MYDPCRCLRRCISCHGVCCPRPSCGPRPSCCPRPSCGPRPSCCERSCSLNTRNCRVVFPGEFQKFSDMVPPSFLQKPPKSPKKRKRSKSCSACEDKCKDACSKDACVESCMESCMERCLETCEEGNGISQQNPEDCEQEDVARTGAYGAGLQNFAGTGFGFQPGQPTIIPCYGTYGPTGNAMIFGIPPPTQYGNFGVPGPMVLPVAQPTSVGQGDPRCIPAAGLPTQYTNKFNPCTGEVYQCGDQQMPAGRPQGTGQAPAYDQFFHSTGLGFATNNQYNPLNVTQGTFQPYSINQRPVTQSNPSVGNIPANSRKNSATNCEPNNRNYTNNVPQSTSQVRSGVSRSEVTSQQRQVTPSRQVPQLQPSRGQLPQGATRSKSLNQRSQSRADHSGRAPNQANNTGASHMINPSAQRSKSLNHRNDSREGRSGKSQTSRAPSSHHSNNAGARNVDPRTMPKSMASAGEVRARNNRSHDSRNRNKSVKAPSNSPVGAPSNRQPVLYGQQNVGMGIDPSNQYYPYNDCSPLNATFVQDGNPFYNQPGQEINRPQSARAANLSKEGTKKDKNANKVPSSLKPANEKAIKCYCTRFDPNNQYYPYYVSEESDCPPGEIASSGKKRTQEKNCSELLSRTSEPCPPCDLQKWCHLLMPKDKSKKQTKPAAKKNKKSNGSRAKNKMSEHSAKEIEDTETSAPESPGDEDADCPPPTKPEMRNCSCSANLPEENVPSPPAASNPAPAPVNTGCMPCSNQCPWSWYYNPCTGCYYYCANCCNGCRNCCNYCCSPCGRCCSNSHAAQLEKITPKPKQKEKSPTISSSLRNSGGAAVTPVSCGPPPSFAPWNCPRHVVSTMPGYCPTASPHFSSPYSGRWEAGGVDIQRNNHRNNQGPFHNSCVRHV
ncbi:uncharacterized protein LOC6533926 [Drosophila yakuba]|uniref:Uncharacterized protein n=1 Tax=Drosophila yakuba TaxID=7245 RepID=B4PGU9_DROYA|nr:uncharacterized protein LOC6533926 [Drosophila yakuba]EDW94338.2 uncharacterized protein Dyak_GE21923 [Drosophila yakuba]